MAFIHLNKGTEQPEAVLRDAFSNVGRLKDAAVALRSSVTASSMTAEQAFNFMQFLSGTRGLIVNAASSSGVRAAAKAAVDDPSYDLAAEHAALMAAIDDLLLWFQGNFPTEPSGGLDVYRFNGDGLAGLETYVVPTTGPLGGKLDTLIAAIGD